MMSARKKADGSNKARETYLLSSLIFCGEFNSPMQGNRRKSMYVSYRGGRRV